LKQEIGNENIQCEKILLDNIKKNNKNKFTGEESETVFNNENSEIKIKENNSNSEADQSQIKENFIIDDYVERIEKFIEGEINHLNKFQFFINDFKEKSKKYMGSDKHKRNLKTNNIFNPSSIDENNFNQSGKKINQNSNSDEINVMKKLRGIFFKNVNLFIIKP